jgi:hypothetical protein
MGSPREIDQRPEIRVDCNQNALLFSRDLQQRRIAGVGLFIPSVPHVVTLLA